MTPTATRTRQTNGSMVRSALLAIGTATVAGIILCLIIATIAKAAGVPKDFSPLSVFYTLVLIGVALGAVGWIILGRRSSHPRALMNKLVPLVLLLSLIPDVLVGWTKSLPHTTWGGVLALMAMHLAVAAVAVPTYRRFLPLPIRRP